VSEQPEALRLADAQDCVTDDDCGYCQPCVNAAELRRLHAEVERLRFYEDSRGMFIARLEKMQEQGDKWLTILGVLALLSDCDMYASRSAAIAKAEEVKP
jgi:hypothetical protein